MLLPDDRPNGKEVIICGRAFWMARSEGMITFSELRGMWGCGERVSIFKLEPTGLLYCKAETTRSDGFIPACVVIAAVKMATEFIGPNHFVSIAAEIAFNERMMKERQKRSQEHNEESQPPDIIDRSQSGSE